ncbi:MAG: extracellular solute-binding protein [Thermomicrobiales bacterium]
MVHETRRPRYLSRRRFLGGIAGASAATLAAPHVLAGPASGTFAAPTLLRQGEEAKIVVWGGVPEENGPADLVAAFQEANPTIKVTYTRYVNDDTGNTQLDTALQGGGQIDVYFSYSVPRMSQRIGAGVAEDLTPNVEADAALKQWSTDTTGIYQQEGKYFSLPTTLEAAFFFVNKRLVDEAGWTAPGDWTVDAFREMSAQLSGDGVFGTYAPPDIARMILGPNHWYKAGGTESNFDDPAFQQYLELHRGMIEEESAFPWAEVLAQNLRAYPQNVFLTEQAATWQVAAWALRYVRDMEEYPHEWLTTFLPLPQPTGVEQWYNSGGINNWIMLHPESEQKDAAWTLIQYWLTDGARYMLKGGKVPAVPGTDLDTVVEGILGPDAATLFDVEAFKSIIGDTSVALATDDVTTAAAEIQQIYQAVTDRYLIGEITIDECVETVKQQADDAIQQASS